MIARIVANVIAFVAIFNLFDDVLIWFFGMLSLENFGFGVNKF